jgi:phosphotriesterase-related protein
MHMKLIIAAGWAYLRTGLVIASHTGSSIPAFEQIEILQNEGVSASAFIWVHAQTEEDPENYIKAAKSGAWISIDGINKENLTEYVRLIKFMKEHNLLDKMLLSHDAGWYDPEEENGGEIRGYTVIFENLIPLLRKEHISEAEINQPMVTNPARAFEIRIRKARNFDDL